MIRFRRKGVKKVAHWQERSVSAVAGALAAITVVLAGAYHTYILPYAEVAYQTVKHFFSLH